MKNNILAFACGILALAMFSCAEKKKDETIITQRIVKKPSNEIKTIGDYQEKREVEWVGSTYTLEFELKADKSLPTVSEGSQKYYDNRVLVRIIRKDGSEFFSKTFTKADFAPYLDDKTAQTGALLGVVFNRVEENNVCFSASVGSPDILSDSYVPLLVKISRFGAISIGKDTLLDTDAGSSGEQVVEDEEIGV